MTTPTGTTPSATESDRWIAVVVAVVLAALTFGPIVAIALTSRPPTSGSGPYAETIFYSVAGQELKPGRANATVYRATVPQAAVYAYVNGSIVVVGGCEHILCPLVVALVNSSSYDTFAAGGSINQYGAILYETGFLYTWAKGLASPNLVGFQNVTGHYEDYAGQTLFLLVWNQGPVGLTCVGSVVLTYRA